MEVLRDVTTSSLARDQGGPSAGSPVLLVPSLDGRLRGATWKAVSPAPLPPPPKLWGCEDELV